MYRHPTRPPSPGFSRLVVGFAFAWALAVAVVPGAQPSLAAQDVPDEERGERIMNAACLDCHDIRRIHTQAKTPTEWATTVAAEIERGAKVAQENVQTLVDYLSDHHGPMPAGQGRAIVLQICTMCHDLKRIKLGRRSPEEWEETLSAMLNEGAPLPDEAFPIVHAYLSRNFGIE